MERQILAALLALFALGIGLRAFRQRAERIDVHLQRDSVAAPGAQSGARELNSEEASVDLNQCKESELIRLPSVGPALAKAILRHRAQIGAFEDPRQLLEVRGFGRSRYERLRMRLLVKGRPGEPLENAGRRAKRQGAKPHASGWGRRRAPPSLIDINAADAARWAELPGIGKSLAERIVQYRERRGGFRAKTDLLHMDEIPLALYRRIEPWLCVGSP